MSKEKRMDWKKLLSKTRVSDIENYNTNNSSSEDVRSAFEKDFDQIVFSYPFRRLQDKTQVIPFPEYDFVHNRLTHSLEVASVGRSLGKLAAIKIAEIKNAIKDKELCPSDIGTLVAAACLAHDIGNPPFGHSGEDAISSYFDNYRYHYEDVFENNKKMWHDLSNFEGNANGFRIITKNCDRGINPTSALLGTYSKYPRESLLEEEPFIDNKPKSQSKYGFFQEQRDLFKWIAEELGLIRIEGINENDIAYHRHPLAFLIEVADDIAYSIIDFEDGCRLGWIDFEKKYSLKIEKKKKILTKTPKQILVDMAELFPNYFNKDKLNNKKHDTHKQISYLRSKVVNVLIHKAFEVFQKEYENIMTGKFDKALVDCIEISEIKWGLPFIKKIVKKCIYHHRTVLENEISGFEVMEHLIDSFSRPCNICYSCGDKETAKDKKLRLLLPKEYRPEDEKTFQNLTSEDIYERYLKILDYVSGMTDNYAMNLYRKIKGIGKIR